MFVVAGVGSIERGERGEAERGEVGRLVPGIKTQGRYIGVPMAMAIYGQWGMGPSRPVSCVFGVVIRLSHERAS